MLEEINEDRIKHGKKPIEDITKKEVMFDEEIGELKENIETKHIKESLTDQESGCFHKGEKEKCFASLLVKVAIVFFFLFKFDLNKKATITTYD